MRLVDRVVSRKRCLEAAAAASPSKRLVVAAAVAGGKDRRNRAAAADDKDRRSLAVAGGDKNRHTLAADRAERWLHRYSPHTSYTSKKLQLRSAYYASLSIRDNTACLKRTLVATPEVTFIMPDCDVKTCTQPRLSGKVILSKAAGESIETRARLFRFAARCE
jgi:hypothetical protein